MAYHPFRNIGLKLVALSLAALLWLAVGGEETAERYLPVPLEFQNVPTGLEISGDPPASVNARVRGSSGNLARMQLGEVVAVLDLRGVRSGEKLFHLLPEQVRTPFGVDVIEVSPSSFSLRVERSTVEDVLVVPEITGRPAPGYVMGKVTTDPATVRVAGPESRVQQLTRATTEPLSIERASAPLQERMAIGVADDQVRLLGAREALVTVDIIQAPVERAFADVPVRAVDVSSSLKVSLTPATVSVTVRGTRQAVARLTIDDIDAQVDLSDLQAGRYTLPVKIAPVGDVRVATVAPDHVAVRVRP
ncbi:MAG: hypothetical protein GEU99_25630 [Luteitalea sp.]|nr:hypothetical protein [Luteitalea sp.]